MAKELIVLAEGGALSELNAGLRADRGTTLNFKALRDHIEEMSIASSRELGYSVEGVREAVLFNVGAASAERFVIAVEHDGWKVEQRPGSTARCPNLGGERHAYRHFAAIATTLARIPGERYVAVIVSPDAALVPELAESTASGTPALAAWPGGVNPDARALASRLGVPVVDLDEDAILKRAPVQERHGRQLSLAARFGW
ncbi:MAG: hypothetical protein H6805_12480 [Planctomycetes bacterium]|nr:hypothetical protein [Planctomycetota bacterium]